MTEYQFVTKLVEMHLPTAVDFASRVLKGGENLFYEHLYGARCAAVFLNTYFACHEHHV